MKCSNIYKYTEDKIGGVFARYGRFVSRHAWKIIIATLIVNGGLAIGIMNLQSDIASDNIYLPQGEWVGSIVVFFLLNLKQNL